jgi:hypothetical protein
MDEGLFAAFKRRTSDVVMINIVWFLDDIDYFVVMVGYYIIHCMSYNCMISIGC